MAVADIAARLYQSSAYRNTSVPKALKDSIKLNLKLRFSLIGLAATLTGSNTLTQIATQKYLISDEEKNQEKKDIEFKKFTVASITTLTKQVAILESITEKNSTMITMVMNDLGYFKNQRKINPLTFSGQMSAVRIPVKSKTVKGKIEQINAEIQALKNIRQTAADETARSARIKKIKEEKNKEKDRNKALIAAAIAGTLATLGIKSLGGSGLASLLGGAGVAGAAALLSSEALQGITKKIVGKAIPVVGAAFKIGLAYKIGMNVYERQRKRIKTGIGVQTGDEKDYQNTINKETNPEGWRIRQAEIDMRKNLDDLLEGVSRPLDNAISGILVFLGGLYGAKAVDFILKNSKKTKGLAAVLGGLSRSVGGGTTAAVGAAETAATSAATRVGAGSVNGVAAILKNNPGAQILKEEGGRALVLKRGATKPTWQTLPPPPAAPPTPRSLGEAPRSVGGSTARRIRRYVPRPLKRALLKAKNWAKGPAGGAAKTGIAGIALMSMSIIDMMQTVSAYENRIIEYPEYKERMVSGLKDIVDTVGVWGIGGLFGGMVGGPLGFVAGVGGGLLAQAFFDESKLTYKAAELLFSIFGEGAPPPGSDPNLPMEGEEGRIELPRRRMAGRGSRGGSRGGAAATTVGSLPEGVVAANPVFKSSGRNLLEFIGKYEASPSGNYNSVVGGGSINLTDMTIEQVLMFQQARRAAGEQSSAVGKYQFVYNTLLDEVNAQNIDIKNTKFTPEIQDKLIYERLVRVRGLKDYASGKITATQFAENLSKEFASLPSPIKGNGLLSYYQDVGNNRALVTLDKVYDIIGARQERAQFLAANPSITVRETGGTAAMVASASQPLPAGQSIVQPPPQVDAGVEEMEEETDPGLLTAQVQSRASLNAVAGMQQQLNAISAELISLRNSIEVQRDITTASPFDYS